MIDQVMASTWKQAPKIQQFDLAHQNILFHFIQSASVDIYCQWVADGKQIPLEKIIELSNQLLCSGVDRFMLSQS
ncbi:hypothetical protein KQI13_05915 [Anaerostipes hadrus]|nr:hypothetical protein [Anaerostipes hadrus]